MEYSFGAWVKRRRKSLDMTQQELAQRVGCSVSAVYKIESDERRPSRQIAELLSEHLEIPPDQHELFLRVARQEKNIDHLKPIPAVSGLESAVISNQPRNNLPVPPTPLVGREHELNIVVRQLLGPSCRVLTLTGPGGVGKTRLSIEVARRLEGNFSDGVFFLSMAGVGSPESIIPSIADGLDIAFSGPADPKLQIINYLRNKEILLVFDDLEHLLAGGSLLSEILQKAARVKMLLTSREPLHLQWEWIFEVQGLPIPEEVDAHTCETNSAVRLFLQRAQQTSMDFSLDAEDASALVHIIKLVDGLPLAIELAASWVRILSIREIVIELEQGLDFLETTLQDVPQRHRSIRNVFDHSWKLLTDEERVVLMKLSVFKGGFTREAASRVADTSLTLLSALAGKSLLRHNKKTDRYDLHELTRLYALARLNEQPSEEERTFEKHSQYFAHWLNGCETPLKSTQQFQISAHIRTETSNWLSAWQWAAKKRKTDLLRKMIACLYWYYEIHGYYAEALSTYHLAEKALRTADAPHNLTAPEEQSTFAFLIDQLGWFEFRTGNVERASVLFSESLEMARPHKDQEVLYHIHGNWGYLSLLNGEYTKAKHLTMESLTNAQALKSQWHIAIPLSVLGIVEYQEGNLTEAQQQLTDSLKIWRSVGDPRGLVFCMLYLATVALTLGDTNLVKSILQESNIIAKKSMDRWAQAFGLDMLGLVALSQSQNEEARDLFLQSLALSRSIGYTWGGTLILIHLGEAQAALGLHEEAKRLFLEVYAKANQEKWTPMILEVLVAYISMDCKISPETRMAVVWSVLSHSATEQNVRAQAERLRDKLSLLLTKQQIETAKSHAREKKPEAWAQEIIK